MCSPQSLPIDVPIVDANRRILIGVTGRENLPSEALRLHRDRRDFLLFIRVLLKCIEKSDDYKLALQTRAMVKECVKRNRMKDEHFMPLQQSVECRLQGLVGLKVWSKARAYMNCYRTVRADQLAHRLPLVPANVQ